MSDPAVLNPSDWQAWMWMGVPVRMWIIWSVRDAARSMSRGYRE